MSQIEIDIEHLTKLARIKCDAQEKSELQNDLKNILKHVESLNEVDTSNVSGCSHILENLYNVFREDEPNESLQREAFLADAPAHIAGMIRVPTVLKNPNP